MQSEYLIKIILAKPLEAICDRQCLRIQNWMNDYPRKQLGYQTPNDLFIREFHKKRKG